MKQLSNNYILSRDGLKLNYAISHIENPRALICVFHGHGEYLGRYEHVAKHLNDENIACIRFDFRGHGRSDGKRGHIPSIQKVLDDVEESLKLARSEYLGTPMFIFGHGFGGCVVMNYVLRKPVLELKGFIASSPWLRLALEPPQWKLNLVRATANLLPRLSLTSELDESKWNKISDGVNDCSEDPLAHNRISTRFFSEANAAGQYALDHADELKVNGLMYCGNSDKIIDRLATKDFSEKAGKRMVFHELAGFCHEPPNDLGKDDVLRLISDWIDQMTKNTGS